MKFILGMAVLILGFTCISMLWKLQDKQIAMNELHMHLIDERIEHLRLKAAMAYLYMDDIVEKKDGTGVEIIWRKRP